MDWSPQQQQAIAAAQAWIKDPAGPQVHRIFGYAGTGKTTLTKEVATELKDDVLYAAFTGKAASVMRRKGCKDASTIHSLIYRLKEENSGDPEFELNRDSPVRYAKLVIIDEVSMVDEVLGKDLLSFGTKVLVLGDPAQLPPIKGTGFFTIGEPDTMLTEVHRQAKDNPIIRLSMQVREGHKLEVGDYGGTRIITRDDLKTEDIMAADQIIVGLNRTRFLYNDRLRELLGRSAKSKMPVRGDKLVCLRNDRKAKVLNGTIWFVEKAKVNDITVTLTIRPEDDEGHARRVTVRQEFFLGTESNVPWQELKGTQQFTYGYALTCHKSQGSQWNNIVVFDEGSSFREDATRWRYTAVTRAAERLLMVI